MDRVPKKFFDHLSGTDGLFEVRIELGGNIFAFFDKGRLVVLGNGFHKKTPKSEIEKAIKTKKEYESDRGKEHHDSRRDS